MSDALRELYQEVILDHSRRPRNFGPKADANRTAQGNNPYILRPVITPTGISID